MIAEGRATVMMGVPTMYFYILNHSERSKYKLSSLRLCVSGGAPMPMDIYSRLKMEMKATERVVSRIMRCPLARDLAALHPSRFSFLMVNSESRYF
jgi:acyl-CoA synthetase (AMP-forming)/AMP-acid ligase II